MTVSRFFSCKIMLTLSTKHIFILQLSKKPYPALFKVKNMKISKVKNNCYSCMKSFACMSMQIFRGIAFSYM